MARGTKDDVEGLQHELQLLCLWDLQVMLAICSALLHADVLDSSEAQRVVFTTVRPSDYSVPYTVLEKNSVAFSAVDKRSNKLLTVMVSVLQSI